MNSNLSLLKVLSLATLTIALIAPVKIVKAASTSSPTNKASTVPATEGQHTTAGQPKTAQIPELVASPKGQQIEFFAFLSIIGLFVVVPELLYNPKENSQSLDKNESNSAINEQTSNLEKNIPSLQIVSKKIKALSLTANNLGEFNEQEENQNEQEQKAA